MNATRPLVLSPEESAELEQKITEAERSAAETRVPGTVVDLVTWLRRKLDAAGEDALIELDPELAAELEQAVREADEDLAQGRHVARETVFPRTHPAG
jgi:cell wall assembly regulator SMI1